MYTGCVLPSTQARSSKNLLLILKLVSYLFALANLHHS